MSFYLQNVILLHHYWLKKKRNDAAAYETSFCNKQQNKMAAAKLKKKKTAIDFDSLKYKHHFDFIWSKWKNIEVGWMLCVGNKTLSR